MAFGRKKEKTERVKLEKGAYKRAATFLKFVRPYRGVFGIGFIFLFLSSGIGLLFPVLLGKLLGAEKSGGFDQFDLDVVGIFKIGETTNVYNVAILIFAVFVLQSVFSFFRIYLFGIVTQNSLRDFRIAAFKQLITSPMSFFNKNKVGELTSRIATDISLLQDTLNTTIAEFLRQCIIIVGGLVYIFTVDPMLSLVMVGLVPVAAVSAVIFGKFIKKLSKEAQNKAAESNGILDEALTGIVNLKTYTNEFFEVKRYTSAVDDIKKVSIKGAVWRGAFVAFIMLFMLGSIIAVIVAGIIWETEDFLSFIMMTIFMGASIASFPDLFAKIQKAVGSTEDMMKMLSEETENINTLKPVDPNFRLNGKIDIKNLSFHYDTREDIGVLKNLNISINKGEQLALVGASGSGKSTLASLLLKLYNPVDGEILYDDKNASDFDLGDLRSQIAFVPQEVILLGGTIKENILYGKPSATEEEVIEAAKKANAWEFISTFPEGLETIVGDRGIQLSGGQRQRIAIARAILKNPSILILDEATSALDSESEKLVQDAIERLMDNRTSVVIAHRLSTIRNADQIIVLDKGEVVEFGTHDELSQKTDGHYKKLSALQFQN